MTAAAHAPATLARGTSRTRSAMALDAFFAVVLMVGTFLGVLAVGLLLFTLYQRGWGRLAEDPAAFLTNFVSRFPARAGIKAALYGTFWLMGLTALFSFPIAVGAAIYL